VDQQELWSRVQQLLVEPKVLTSHKPLSLSLPPLSRLTSISSSSFRDLRVSLLPPPTRTRRGALQAEETRGRPAASRLSFDSSTGSCLPSVRRSRTCIPSPRRTGSDAFARPRGSNPLRVLRFCLSPRRFPFNHSAWVCFFFWIFLVCGFFWRGLISAVFFLRV
jgi:hypothetical protein